ncbi:hypothetical protein FRC02_001714 [Tulasnella sp. 418]|nr:hypothetical protein FRC02_001714 [Tulasnella sp. 418]
MSVDLKDPTRVSVPVLAPATELIYFLIQSLEQEVSEGIRGARIHRHILNRAQDICNHLNEIIEDVEMNKDWGSYVSWNAQIGPLQDVLLEISGLIESETEVVDLPLVPESISQCLDHIRTWKENRKICRDAAYMLRSTPFELPKSASDSDLIAAAQLDDLSWISVICEALTNILTPLAPDIRKKPEQYSHITEVIKLLAELHTSLELTTGVAQESSMVLSTRCFMVMYGVITVANEPSAGSEVQKHLLSPGTWKLASGLLQKLKDCMESSASLDELFKDWEAFEGYLLVSFNPKAGRVDDILGRLVQYSAKIQQPYHSQSLALINSCLNIGAQVKLNHPHDGLEALESIVDSTINALETCVLAGREASKFDWNESPVNRASLAIKRVVDDMKVVYKCYRMKEDDFDSMISSALERDNAYSDSLRKYLISGGYQSDSGMVKDILYTGTDPEAIQRSSNAKGLAFNSTPATARIAFLVQSISEQMSDLGRPQTLNFILDRARVACRKMDEFILKAERNKDWNVYSQSTTMMRHLEQNLFRILDVASNRIKQLELTVQQQVIKTCLQSTDSWKAGGDAVKDLLAIIFSENWLEHIDHLITPETTVGAQTYILGVAGSLTLLKVPNLTGQWSKLEIAPIATGGNSDVFVAKLGSQAHPNIEQTVAVKVLRQIRIPMDSHPSEILNRRLLREMLIWSKLQHGNIVPFLGYAFDGDRPCMISPWYENGDVIKYVRQHPEMDKSRLVRECIDGLVYLHSRQPPVIHGDLKAVSNAASSYEYNIDYPSVLQSNVLIDNQGHARIADFGLSRVHHDGPTGLTTSTGHVGSFRWMAPELILNDRSKPTAEADIYALTLSALEIYTGKTPYHHLQQVPFVLAISRRESPQRLHYEPFDPTEHMWQVFEKGWSYEPNQRPNALDFQRMFLDALGHERGLDGHGPVTICPPVCPTSAGTEVDPLPSLSVSSMYHRYSPLTLFILAALVLTIFSDSGSIFDHLVIQLVVGIAAYFMVALTLLLLDGGLHPLGRQKESNHIRS